MEKIRVLHIGIKNWPFDAAFKSNSKRGGGSNKYTNLLINGYSDKVNSFIITQLVKGQKSIEEYPNGIKVFRIKTFGGRKTSQIFFNIKSLFLALKIIRKNNIDIIHGHMLVGIIVSVFLGKFYKIPVVSTPYSVYTTEFGFPLINIARFLEKLFYKKSDAVIFESEENRRKTLTILRQDLPNSKVIVTGINIPNETSKIQTIEYYKNNKIKILFVGRLVNIKALDNLLYGILKLHLKEKIILQIIGEGEEYNNLEKIIIDNDLFKTVKLLGFIDDIDIYLKAADIFILPSHMEGLSIALLEAMSYGLCCIVNDFGVPFSSSVFTLKNNNPEEIELSIRYFIENPSIINEFKMLARKTIEKEYSVDVFSTNYYRIYKLLID